MNCTSTEHSDLQSSILVSVVIPSYNAQDTIDETLKSVRSQTHSNLEIIVVDDGSTDRTSSIVGVHASDDKRVRVILQENAGVAAARNKGWQAASARFIAFVDADDLWKQSKIERQLHLMLRSAGRVGLVYTWYVHIDSHSRILRRPNQRKVGGQVLDLMLLGNLVGNGSSALVRRNVLESVGGFDSGLQVAGAHGCEDFLFYFRVASAFEFALIPDYLTGYRILDDRMSSDRPRMLNSWLLVAAEMKLSYPEKIALVERGLTYYVRFLLVDAFSQLSFGQVRQLISIWVAHRAKGTLFRTYGMLVRTLIEGLKLRVQVNLDNLLKQRWRYFRIGLNSF